jgi:hypothetical protein
MAPSLNRLDEGTGLTACIAEAGFEIQNPCAGELNPIRLAALIFYVRVMDGMIQAAKIAQRNTVGAEMRSSACR